MHVRLRRNTTWIDITYSPHADLGTICIERSQISTKVFSSLEIVSEKPFLRHSGMPAYLLSWAF